MKMNICLRVRKAERKRGRDRQTGRQARYVYVLMIEIQGAFNRKKEGNNREYIDRMKMEVCL